MATSLTWSHLQSWKRLWIGSINITLLLWSVVFINILIYLDNTSFAIIWSLWCPKWIILINHWIKTHQGCEKTVVALQPLQCTRPEWDQYCTISTVGSVTCHRRPWTEHLQYFIVGHSWLWTSFQTRIQYFQCLLGHFEDKTEPILHSITLIFTCELGPIVFTTVTGHTLWTYGRNGTVSWMLNQYWNHSSNIYGAIILKSHKGSVVLWEPFRDIWNWDCRAKIKRVGRDNRQWDYKPRVKRTSPLLHRRLVINDVPGLCVVYPGMYFI